MLDENFFGAKISQYNFFPTYYCFKSKSLNFGFRAICKPLVKIYKKIKQRAKIALCAHYFTDYLNLMHQAPVYLGRPSETLPRGLIPSTQ